MMSLYLGLLDQILKEHSVLSQGESFLLKIQAARVNLLLQKV